MQLQLKDNLPFTEVTINHHNHVLKIENVLVDTGSASTIFAADIVAAIQISPAPEDILHTIRGVGGDEVVFRRKIDFLSMGQSRLANFEIEVGGMDYGFEINGILGMDFLVSARAIINLHEMKIEFTPQ